MHLYERVSIFAVEFEFVSSFLRDAINNHKLEYIMTYVNRSMNAFILPGGSVQSPKLLKKLPLVDVVAHRNPPMEQKTEHLRPPIGMINSEVAEVLGYRSIDFSRSSVKTVQSAVKAAAPSV